MQQQFGTVFVFLLIGLGFLIVSQVASYFFRTHNLYPSKQTPYECGEEIEGSPWVQFNIRFYLIALFFIVFDVETIFILPWAVVFTEMLEVLGPFAFIEMAVFVAILFLGLAYVWSKGDLEWVKRMATHEQEPGGGLSEYSSGKKLGQPGIGASEYV